MKPSIPKGTRDFSPTEVANRTYIMNTIKTAFETFGFQPIETPSFENSSTLMGKYGEEGDRLIFKILNSGDYFEKLTKNLLNFDNILSKYKKLINEIVSDISNIYDKESDFNDNHQIFTFKNSIYKPLSNISNFFDSNFSIELFFDLQDSVVYKMMTDDIEESKEFILDLATDVYLWNSNIDFKLKNWLANKFVNNTSSNNITSIISEKALRYDLTVPFARYVVQHQNEIDFPFKRYQMQPVWRADRPQKGRFREFFQCDADVVGSDSLLQEVELVQLYDAVFTDLKLEGVTIKLNNRKILAGIAEVIGERDKLIDFTVALDKLDKIGEEGVRNELDKNGFDLKVGNGLFEIIGATGSNEERLDVVSKLVSSAEVGAKGVEEAKFLLENLKQLNLKNEVVLDISLARGLDYYTGAIFEVKAKNVEMGSIGGGGRYDDLTGIFGMKNLSGIGISFGLDRIQIVMEELGLFTDEQAASTEVLFVNFGEKESLFSLSLANDLRDLGVKAEVFPDNAKMKKQLDFANKKNIPNVVMIGSQEMEAERFTMKNMSSGTQQEYSRIELLEHFSTQKGNEYGRH